MKIKEPITFIIFGATGDLAQNKILPALSELYLKDLLPEHFKIVGFSRKDLTDSDYREYVQNVLNKKIKIFPEEKIYNFLEKIHYKQGDITNIETYKKLSEYLSELDRACNCCSNKLFYLAVPPNLYEKVFENVYESGLCVPCLKPEDHNWTRLLVEKPFGSDLNEAKKLDKKLGELFDENQIFRIDHYLAKEAIQNILTFRFANAIFEPLWNNKNIESVNIKLHEKNSVSGRINFYDEIGALKDVGQNHMLQMLALVAMEDPANMKADSIRSARNNVLSKVRLYSDNFLENIKRGQYESYRKTDGIKSNSNTETYFKIKLKIENERWSGVPFYIESGKSLSENKVEIEIVFKDKKSSVCLIDDVCHYNNTLKIMIQPKEEINICFWTRKHGLNFDLEQKNLSFEYDDGIGVATDAYQKVLYDAILGDQTLFSSTKEIENQWALITYILKNWQKNPLYIYKDNSNPEEIK